MEGYNSGPRPLTWSLKQPLVETVIVEDDGDFPPSSFSWPEDPNERVMIPFYLSLNEYNILGSTIDVGSDIAFAEDALRVVWLWMRNWRIQVPICAAVDDCIENNPATIASIVNQLLINPTFNTYITQQVNTNVYPPRPTAATPDPLCNAATYVVSKIRELISDIYDDLETLTAQEVLEALLGLFGWQSGPLYQLIGLLETNDKTALLAAYDAATPDLICQLIEDELDQTAVLAWVATTYPSPSVLGDALTRGIESAADEGKWAQWIAVGATMTTADCADCGEPPPDPNCVDFEASEGGWASNSGFATYFAGQGWGTYVTGGHGYFDILRAPDSPPGIVIVRMRIVANESIDGLILAWGGNNHTVTTSVTSIDIDESSDPSMFPYNTQTDGYLRMYFPSLQDVSPSLRIQLFCMYEEE